MGNCLEFQNNFENNLELNTVNSRQEKLKEKNKTIQYGNGYTNIIETNFDKEGNKNITITKNIQKNSDSIRNINLI